ncbi:MAG: secretin N-terminal domain-containing protein [Sumerlaeia bacterium]
MTGFLLAFLFLSLPPIPAQEPVPWRSTGSQSSTAGNGGAAVSGEELLDLRVPDLPLQTVLGMLANASPKTLILGDGVKQTKVTAFFENVTFRQALDSLASAYQLEIVETDSAILLLSRRDYMNQYAETRVVTVENASPEALAESLNKTVTSPDELIRITADPRARALILRGTPERIAHYEALASQLDSDLETRVIQVRFGSAESIAKDLREVLLLSANSLGGIVVDDRSNRIIVTEKANKMSRALDFIREVDVPVETRVFSTGRVDPQQLAERIQRGELGAPAAEGGARGRTTTNVQVVEGANQIIVTDTPERLDNLAKVMNEIQGNLTSRVFSPMNSLAGENASIVTDAFPQVLASVDSRTNSLILTGERQQVDMAYALLQERDQVTNIQVEIEAKILLVATRKIQDIGWRIYGSDFNGLDETFVDGTINPNFPADGPKPIGSVLGNPPGGPIDNPIKTTNNYLEVIQPNVQANAVIRALEEDRDTELLSNPTIRMLVGNTSEIFSGSREPYRETTLQNEVAIENVQFIDVGVTFEVTPTVNSENLLTLDVRTEFSNLAEVRDGIPVVETRRANSIVEVEDGETIFLGGLITRDKQNTDSGLPFIKRVPIIGNLFKEKRQRDDTRELVIILRPRIQQTRKDADDLPEDYFLAPPALERDVREREERAGKRLEQ